MAYGPQHPAASPRPTRRCCQEPEGPKEGQRWSPNPRGALRAPRNPPTSTRPGSALQAGGKRGKVRSKRTGGPVPWFGLRPPRPTSARVQSHKLGWVVPRTPQHGTGPATKPFSANPASGWLTALIRVLRSPSHWFPQNSSTLVSRGPHAFVGRRHRPGAAVVVLSMDTS